MKTIFFFLLFAAASFSLRAQTRVELTAVSKHVGDSIVVKGQVSGSRLVSGGKLLLLNLGGAYPNQLLTVVLEEPVQKVLAEPLKAELQGMTIAGKVELYKGKPQLVVKDPAQIHSLITEKAGQ